MRRNLEFAAASALSLTLAGPVAEAQKSGGVLIMSHFDSAASMSMHEEAMGAVNRPMMGVFNNLVMFGRMWRKTAWHRSFRTWRPAGRGTRRGPSLPCRCIVASEGTTANRLPPTTSNASGTC